MKRSERVGAIVKILSDHPSRVFPLQYFCERLGAAKSSISEDLQAASVAMRAVSGGIIETIAGARGGVRYLPDISDGELASLQAEFCSRLSDPARILTGGFLYTSDIMFDTDMVDRLAAVFVRKFSGLGADYVATIETKGIPLAAHVAHKLGIPLAVIRREAKVSEGSTVSINYFSGSYDRVQKMSLAKRAVEPGSRAIVIDDFMRGGGSMHGIQEILSEFEVSVCGFGVAIVSTKPEKKRIDEYTAIVYLGEVDEERQIIIARPNNLIF